MAQRTKYFTVSKYIMITAKVPGTVPGTASEHTMDSSQDQVTGPGSQCRLVWEPMSLLVLLHCAVSITVHVFSRKEIPLCHWN